MGLFFRVVIRVHYRYSRPRGGVNCLNLREVTSVTPRTRITTMNVVECSRGMFVFQHTNGYISFRWYYVPAIGPGLAIMDPLVCTQFLCAFCQKM